MNWKPEQILSVLDRCNELGNFPALDNGYIYLAATRLSLYKSDKNWALVIEIFGFSANSGFPDTTIYTFASRLNNRKQKKDFISPSRKDNIDRQAYVNYLTNNPYNESRSIFPVDYMGKEWTNTQDLESIYDRGIFYLRGKQYNLPPLEEYQKFNVKLAKEKVQIFEFCRLLAATHRNQILASDLEIRINVLPEMNQILQLESWNHPDIVCLLYTSPSPRDLSTSRMPSSA